MIKRRFIHLLLCFMFLCSLAFHIGPDPNAKTAAAAENSSATVYYYTPSKNWQAVNIHHNGSGSWTAVPGTAMQAACADWTVYTVELGSASSFQAVFTNGSGAWDNNNGANYSIGSGVHQVKNGQLIANTGNPCDAPGENEHNQLTLYYKPSSSWSSVNIHYKPNGGTWTATPGIVMTNACEGWYVKELNLGSATGITAAFNNGSTWDNNGGQDYAIGTGIVQLHNGVISSGSPCAPTVVDTTPPTAPAALSAATITSSSVELSWSPSIDEAGGSGLAGYELYRNNTLIRSDLTAASFADSGLTPATTYIYKVLAKDLTGNKSAFSPELSVTTAQGNVAEVYYSTENRGWSTVNIHYAPAGSAWTTAPGIAMNENACAGWVKKTVSLGSAASMKAAFNNGAGAWDNNNGQDYTIAAGVTTVKNGIVTANAANPCTPLPADEIAPTVPGNLTAAVNGLRVSLSWEASQDNPGGRGVAGYEITRTGGTAGSKTYTTAGTSFTDTATEAQTTYTYTIKAYDKAEPANISAASAPVTATTGDAPLPPVGGEPLGRDMREDTIYFVMTARFYDGDSSNNMGGQMHVSSGNAAYNDPMFRGDFKGLIEKLDYIKALGFSAIWITPVVLNRSDYDFHGYHGWDFYRVDPRLESPGATYQDLINAAHNKDIKIIQDVVYNHSSRWGEKNLFVPTVFGIRDSKWSWYYDEPIPGFEYDGITVPNPSGKAYNGDLWSTEEPAGNTCANWGMPMNNGNYHCQWPNPTSGMFPAEYYHQCWIGNWEGEDSRSCWIHEDLADFNTESEQVQSFLKDVYRKYIEMGVDGFRIDTAVHIPRVIWNRHFLPDAINHSIETFGEKGEHFFMFGEVGSFVNDKWNRGSVNHSAQFFTWKERRQYSADDAVAVLEQYQYENNMGTGNQPTSDNAFLYGNSYHTPDHSQFSGMSVIDMRMHMNFSDAGNAFWNGKDSDDSYNDATFNVVYVDSHDYGPNKSNSRYAGGTEAWAENMSLMWTFRGIPTLYYGSEIEFQAGKPADCGPTCALATTGRAYFGDHIEGTVVASDFGVVQSASGPVAETLEHPLVRHVQRLNMIRREIPALQKGQYSTEGIQGSIAYKRRYTDTEQGIDSFALIAVSSSATFSGIPNGTYKDAITGDVKHVSNGTLRAELSGKGNLRIYVLDLPGNAAPGKIGEDGPFLK